MLRDILPEGVHFKVAEPWMWESPASDQEETLIARAVDKRKREFRAGRHATRALFQSLSIDHAHLLKGKQREPAWPAGWVGSISHTDGFCAAVLASTDIAASIGLDVELATPLNSELRELICRPEELVQVNALRLQHGAGLPFEKLIFSAKESIHKVYFPLNFHTLDFLDARIEINWKEGSFSGMILNPEPAPRIPITHLQGRFMLKDRWIFTAIVLPADNLNPPVQDAY